MNKLINQVVTVVKGKHAGHKAQVRACGEQVLLNFSGNVDPTYKLAPDIRWAKYEEINIDEPVTV